MSLGVVARALFILFIVLLSDKIADHYVLIAIVYAFSEILYWCAHELIYIDITNNHNRKKYMSIKKILGKIVNIVSPIILGTSIELYSFSQIAVYVFLLSIIQIIINLFIKQNVTNDRGGEYSFRKFINYSKKIIFQKYKNTIYQVSHTVL